MRYPAEVFRKKNPPTITVHVGLHGNGVLWVKDVELLHLPRTSTPTGKKNENPAANQPLRDLVSSTAKNRDTIRLRYEAGVASKLDLVLAEIELTEARIRLARENGDQAEVIGLHKVLVAHRKEERISLLLASRPASMRPTS